LGVEIIVASRHQIFNPSSNEVSTGIRYPVSCVHSQHEDTG